MSLLRSALLNVPEYTLHHYACRVKLNQNENPYDLPEGIKKEILDAFARVSWSRYPEFVPARQIAKVAAFAGWHPEGTLLGNGSNDLLQLLFTCVLEKGRTVVLSQPTFTLYKLLASSLGADVREVRMRPGFLFDTPGIIAAARETRASMIVLCSPNNPTGSALAKEDVLNILSATESLVVLDEAYVHFAGESCVDLLHENPRLVILQTFSKALGAASLRLGYSLASAALTRQIAKIKLPYNVNAFSLLAAEVLMQHWPELKGWLGKIVGERERLRAALGAIIGLKVYPSQANFLLVETTRKSPQQLFRLLLDKEILIRDVSAYPLLSHGVRISVGTPSENDELLGILKEVA